MASRVEELFVTICNTPEEGIEIGEAAKKYVNTGTGSKRHQALNVLRALYDSPRLWHDIGVGLGVPTTTIRLYNNELILRLTQNED